jgi:hypothetical protein
MSLGWNNPADPQSAAYGAAWEAWEGRLGETIEAINTFMPAELDGAVQTAISDAVSDTRLSDEGFSTSGHDLQVAAWQRIAALAAAKLAQFSSPVHVAACVTHVDGTREITRRDAAGDVVAIETYHPALAEAAE